MSRRPTFQASYPSGSSPEGVRSPINSTISYPQVLDPEHGPQTVHTSDLYFANSRPMNPRQNTEFPRRTSNPSNTQPRPTSSELYPYHLQGFQHHYSPSPPVFRARQDTYSQYQPPPPTYLQQHPTYGPIYPSDGPPAPPLPPKPIEYPTITTAPSYGQYAATQPPPPPLPPPLPPLLPPAQEVEEIIMSPTEDSNELAMAIALSQSESIERQKLQEDLRNQEEEDLAKALAESLLSTGSHVNESMNPFFIPEEESIAPSPQPAEHTSALPTSEARAAVDLPSHDTPTPTHPANTLPPLSLPTFGRHEKWRIPRVSDNGSEGSHKSDDNASNLDKNPTFKFPSPEGQVPPAESLSRPSSISSITSLAYMRADPNEDGKDVDDQLHDGNQDSTDDPSDTYISNFKDISPSAWTSGDTNDSFVEPEDANVLEFDDEAYARQLAAEEEAMAAQSQYQYPNEKAFPQYGQDYGVSHHYMPEERQNNFYNSSSSSNGQLYATRRPTFSSDSTSSSAPISTPTSSSHSPSVTYSPSSNSSQLPEYGLPASINHFQKRPSISYVNSGSLPYSPVVYPTLGHRHEAEFDSVSDSSHHSSTHSLASAPPALQPGNQTSSAPSLNQRRPSGAAPAVTPGASPVITGAAVPGAGLRNANHFVDAELLLGVSIGFTPPPVTAKLLPLQDPMPNIISLPYNKCPPLHLQAPDWRHLLRLMARLSGTRIEPTVEAMAVSKTDLKLRTVVQFIKPYQHANDWRTILWFTIDHPVPSSMPGAARYSHSNPNMLPWSYTLSPVPMLLRDAADTHISKTYTIPATDSVPLPVLPITFPSLALYLQAALDASRMHSSETSTGLGKLGKLVQMCYPSVEQTYSEFDIPERTRMSDMFKRVIKRSNKDKKKGKGTNNEETYQLVTPFVPDEWG